MPKSFAGSPTVVLLCSVLTISVLPCDAQESAAYRLCNKTAQTQFELDKCASEEAKRADVELNKTYEDLLRSVSKDPNATSNVKAAERAWLAYRDAYIEAMYPAADKQMEYGSMYPMEVDLLIAGLTHDHIRDVRELLRNNSGAP